MPTTGLSIYFQNAAGQILEHPDGYAHVRYHAGLRRPDEYTALLIHLGHLLRRRGWRRVLGDQRLMMPLRQGEKKWLLEQWFTGKVERPAYLITAIIAPLDAAARKSAQQMWNQSSPAISEYHTFADLEQARAFLLGLAPEISFGH
jgi:hypothetical protein